MLPWFAHSVSASGISYEPWKKLMRWSKVQHRSWSYHCPSATKPKVSFLCRESRLYIWLENIEKEQLAMRWIVFLFFSDKSIRVLQKPSEINSRTRCKRKEASKSLKCSVWSFRMKNMYQNHLFEIESLVRKSCYLLYICPSCNIYLFVIRFTSCVIASIILTP